jgi:hypothetical protein
MASRGLLMSIDILVENHGSIMLLHGLSDDGSSWLHDHIGPEAQSWGDAVADEPRYVADIVRGAQADGLEVR